MTAESDFLDLMGRLQQGDGAAATEVFERFARRLIGLASSRLHTTVKPKVDPEDVMQSVMKSFFRRQKEGQFELQSWDSMWALLTVLTLRKCGHRTEYFRANKRDVQREVPAFAWTDDSGRAWQAVARDPTPAEAAMLADTVEQLMRGLNEREREVVSLTLQGYSAVEISHQIGRSERTVHRVLDRVRRHLKQEESSDGSA